MDTAKGGAGLAGRVLVVCEREGRREMARERGVRGHFVCDFRERCVPVREALNCFTRTSKGSPKNNQSTSTNDTHPKRQETLSLCENIKFYENTAGRFKSWMSLTLEFLTRDSAKPRRQYTIHLPHKASLSSPPASNSAPQSCSCFSRVRGSLFERYSNRLFASENASS